MNTTGMEYHKRVQLSIFLAMVRVTGELVIAKVVESGLVFYDGCGELRAPPSHRTQERIRVAMRSMFA